MDSEAAGDLKVPAYDWYGYYGHKRKLSNYEAVMRREYAKWAYSKRVSAAIRKEVEKCRGHAAMFDLSSFGKVKTIEYDTQKIALLV